MAAFGKCWWHCTYIILFNLDNIQSMCYFSFYGWEYWDFKWQWQFQIRGYSKAVTINWAYVKHFPCVHSDVTSGSVLDEGQPPWVASQWWQRKNEGSSGMPTKTWDHCLSQLIHIEVVPLFYILLNKFYFSERQRDYILCVLDKHNRETSLSFFCNMRETKKLHNPDCFEYPWDYVLP